MNDPVFRRLLRKVARRLRPRSDGSVRRRVEMTCGCRDADPVPKVAGAGSVFRHRGERVQRMHQGVLVPAGGYYGDWMTEIIRRLRGHHEPQEELLFHHLLSHCRPGTRIVEIGTFWAYYTAWYLSAVPGSGAICLEPDSNNAACGRRTLALNGLDAVWVAGAAGRTPVPQAAFRRESDGATVPTAIHSLGSLMETVGRGPVEVLHVDAQGAELPFLRSLGDDSVRGTVRFLVVSTHDARISGSSTTHEDCIRAIRDLGGTVLEEHSVEESFSGDGLIVATLDPADASIALPPISRNDAARSLFGFPEPPGGRVLLAETGQGPMIVREADGVIGAGLRARGRWEEDEIVAVVRHLRRTRGFTARTFVVAGANIGTHLIRALRGGMFASGVGIEMDRENFRLLEANAALNLFGGRPLLLNVALGDDAGAAIMERSADNHGDHRIRVASDCRPGWLGEESRTTAPVPMTTLDSVERDHGLAFDESTLVWLDTRGFEGHVLQGASAIMAREPRSRPVVVCELWPYGIERAGGRARLFSFLDRCREIRNLRAPGWQTAPPLGPEEVTALYDRLLRDVDRQAPPHVDLLCLA